MRRLAVLALAATCASSAFAKPPEVRWARGWKEAMAEATDRNVPVVVVFVKQDADGGLVERTVLGSSEYVAASKKWITVYCNRDDGQPTKKVGDKVTSAVTPGLSIDDHIAAWKEISPRLYKNQDATTPSAVWCGLDEKELGRLEGKITQHDLLAKLAEVTKKMGPGLDGDEYQEALDHLAAADAAADAKKTGTAVREYGAVVKMEKTPGSKVVVQRAKDGLNRLNDIGKVPYDKAMECVAAQDYSQAKKMLLDVATAFDGLPIGKEAKKAYDDVVEKEKLKVKTGVGGDGQRPR